MKRLLLPWLVIFLGISGCTHLVDYIEITREKGVSSDYRKVLSKWSRDRFIHSQFETKAHIGATLRSEEFNRAYLREYSRIYRLSEEELREQEGLYSRRAQEVTEFLVYAYLPEKAANDFDRKGTIWKIFLFSREGKRIAPLSIERIEPVTPLITEFFPYVKPYYGVAYWLRFPAVQNRESFPFHLIFTSVVGTVELAFDN